MKRLLGDISITIDYGVTASAAEFAVGPKFLRITDIQNGAVNWDAVPWCDCTAREAKSCQLEDGDIVFARTGATTGKSFLIREAPRQSVFASYLIRVRLGKEANPVYVSHFFNSPDYWRQITGRARGVAQPGVNSTSLKTLEIPLPPLAEQKRIAGILDAADALRAKRREALAQLDTLLQATFLDMFGDPVTNPKGWKTLRFSDLAADSFRNGLSPSTTGRVEGEVLTLSAVTGGRFKFDERKEAFFDKPPAKSQMLSTNTLLICRGNGNKHLVGTAAFPDRSSDEVCFPDTMIGVTVDSKVLTASYLEYVWASRHVRRQIESGARTTNGTYKVNQQTLGSVAFPVPPIVEQKQFARSAAVIENQRIALNRHLAELDTLFASLQSRAFRGEL